MDRPPGSSSSGASVLAVCEDLAPLLGSLEVGLVLTFPFFARGTDVLRDEDDAIDFCFLPLVGV